MPSRAATKAKKKTAKTARQARRSPLLHLLARAGLVARGCFYLLLAALAARIAVGDPHREADPNGALGAVAAQPLGKVAIVLAAVGLGGFAAQRLVSAITAGFNRTGWWPVVRASAEASAYAVLAVFTFAFVLGQHNEGSEQSHRSMTASLLGNGFGRALLAIVGLAVVGFYGYQLYVAITGGFESSLDEDRMPVVVRKVAAIVGSAGIGARVTAFGPVGGFMVAAAVTYNADKAKGLDAMLRDIAAHWWGIALLAVVTLGLASFSIYSFLEAAYRKVEQA